MCSFSFLYALAVHYARDCSCIPYFLDQMPQLLLISSKISCGVYSRAASIFSTAALSGEVLARSPFKSCEQPLYSSDFQHIQ